MKTELKAIKVVNKKDVDVVFERTDGTKIYRIEAQWDLGVGSWFQWGAPHDVLVENVPEVQNYYYKLRSFDFKPRNPNALAN